MSPAHWGVLSAVAACSIWGMAGLFFSLLAHVPPLELFAHRVVWACVFVGAFCLVTGRGARLREAFGSGAWRVLAVSVLRGGSAPPDLCINTRNDKGSLGGCLFWFSDASAKQLALPRYSITGMENSPPSLMPEGQRAVTVFVRV